MNQLIVNTSKTDYYACVGLGIVGIVFCVTVSFFMMDKPGDDNWVWCLALYALFLLLCGSLVLWARLVKNDFIKVDDEGISVEITNCNPFPKRTRSFFQWEDLSSYAFDVKFFSKNIYYDLSLYGKDGELVHKIEFHSLFGNELLTVENRLKDRLANKIKADYEKNGVVTFHARDSKNVGWLGPFVCSLTTLGVILIWTENFVPAEYKMSLSFFCMAFLLLGLVLIYVNHIRQKDYIMVDHHNITFDIHSGDLNRHIHKVVSIEDIGSVETPYSYFLSDVELYDRDDNNILSYNCAHIEFVMNLELLLDEKTLRRASNTQPKGKDNSRKNKRKNKRKNVAYEDSFYTRKEK